MPPKRKLSEQQENTIEALKALGFSQSAISSLQARINIEEEDLDISDLYSYLPLLQTLIAMIPVANVAMILSNDKEKLTSIIQDLDDFKQRPVQPADVQGYQKAITILGENEHVLKQMNRAPSLFSILNTLTERTNLIRYYINLGFTSESMGLILFIQRSQLNDTFRILEENVNLFKNTLKYFSENALTRHLLEQYDDIEDFATRVEQLETAEILNAIKLPHHATSVFHQKVLLTIKEIFSKVNKEKLTKSAQNIITSINNGKAVNTMFTDVTMQGIDQLTHQGFELNKILKMLCFTSNFFESQQMFADNVNNILVLRGNEIGAKTISAILGKFDLQTFVKIEKILKRKPDFDKLYQFGFTDVNLSGMMTGAGLNFETTIIALAACIPTTFARMQAIGFQASNISNIFHSAGVHVPKISADITKQMSVLQKYLALGFQSGSLSSILSDKKTELDSILTILDRHYDSIKQTLEAKVTTPEVISSYLTRITGLKKFVSAIENLQKELQMMSIQKRTIQALLISSTGAQNILGPQGNRGANNSVGQNLQFKH